MLNIIICWQYDKAYTVIPNPVSSVNCLENVSIITFQFTKGMPFLFQSDVTIDRIQV